MTAVLEAVNNEKDINCVQDDEASSGCFQLSEFSSKTVEIKS